MKIHAIVMTLVLGLVASVGWAEGNSPGEAQELAQAEKDLALAKKNKEVIDVQKLIASARKEIAAALKEAAESDRDRNKAELVSKLLGDGYPELRVVSAKILVVEKPSQYCDATYHARFTCHGRPVDENDPLKDIGKCSIEVNQEAKICLLPGFSSQPMLYTVDYTCGPEPKTLTVDVPFGGTAYLTCR